MTPEGKVLSAIVRYLKSLKVAGVPIFYVKLHGSHMQRAGLPDLLIVYRGKMIAVEIKRPGGKPTALQVHTLSEMALAGAYTSIATCVNDVRSAIEETLA